MGTWIHELRFASLVLRSTFWNPCHQLPLHRPYLRHGRCCHAPCALNRCIMPLLRKLRKVLQRINIQKWIGSAAVKVCIIKAVRDWKSW